MNRIRFRFLISFLILFIQAALGQVTPNINSGNPAFPFPQFLDYGPNRKSLASKLAPSMTHAEMEQRTREAWQLVCNNTSPYPNTVVSGIQYLYPTAPNHCTCVEGDGYYLLGAAIMGDKTFFDGYYMWTHDRGFNGRKRFIDGVENPYPGYSRGLSYSGGFGAGTDVYGGGITGNSATDGDVDVALALLIAYKQWGEHSGIFLNHGGWGGKEINYKEEALNYIRAMVDTSIFPPALPERNHVTGVVGLDGYIKRGDSWGELTDWALGGYLGMRPQTSSSGAHYIDYNAPAWFKQFEKFLSQENERQFLIDQYRRGEASSDWLMGLHYSKNAKNIPYMGKVESLANNDFKFGNYIPDGEDFRGPWRTIMNYVWHDNPTYTWDPVTHQVIENTPNTYEYDMAVRYSEFLKNNQGAPWNNPCRSIGDLKDFISFKGPYTLLNGYAPDGSINGGSFPLNWIHGTGAASAIAAQDFELMGDMFRHCVIAWDAATGTNLDSRPIYFHEWFRLCGMLTLAGNFHAPDKMIAQPNLKVYHKVDKTFGFTGDEVTFTVSYRNYGSVDAAGAVVKFGIPEGFEYISSTKGSLSGDSVIWNVGSIPGFKTGSLDATIDSMKITLKIGPEASGRYCTHARISCSNGLGWTSDEYPNNITAVMERNCVDVVKRALKIEKTASRKQVNPTSNGDIVYKIKFKNSSDAGWINGGRPGVRLAFAHEDIEDPTSAAANVLKYRLFHDAAEPYIDYGNYRVSYFMNDPNIKSYGTAGASWGLQNTIAEGVDKDLVQVTHEQIVPGSDAFGSWNQRIVLQFSPQLATITQHLQQYAGSPSMVHEGGTAALRGVWRLFTNNYINVDWSDDWSWDPTFHDDDGGIYFPIGDDYTDPDNLGLPIDSWHKSACQTTNQIVKNVLVEEWDGYVWRRVLGNGPVPGRDISNVIVTDTLPEGVTLKNFIRQTALGIAATTTTLSNGRTLIKWSIPKMQVNQMDSLIYTATITGTCPGADRLLINKAWIEGSSESAISESDTITVTCNAVTICPDPTTLEKSSDKLTYNINDPVTYTLNYTQTQGSKANPDLSSSTDWTAQSGAMSNATFADGKVSIGQINGGDLVLTHDYSYGTNTLGDGIEGTIQISSYAKAAIVVRHAGGSYDNGVFVVIKPAYPSTVEVYNGTNLVGSGSFPDQTPPSIDFRIKLTGDKMDLWIGPTPTNFSGAPSMTFTGITEQAGWAGFSRGTTIDDPSGTGTISSWRTHLDAAFDVEITDPVPTGITAPSAISNSGINDAGVITWNLATGKTPILYGEEQELSWSGIYSACQKVTNVAYVNTRGITGNQYGVCYDINCDASACTLTGGKIGTSRTICYNTTPPPFTETAPAAGGTDYTYLWQSSSDLSSWIDIANSNSTTYTPASLKETTYYRRKVSSAGCSDAYSDTITITVLPEILAPIISADPTTLCSGDPASTLTITGTPEGGTGTFTYQWQRSDDNLLFDNIPGATDITYDPETIASITWYRLVVTTGSCLSENSTSVKITVNPSTTTSVLINDPGAICSGQEVTFTATPTGGGTAPAYQWYKNDEAIPNETNASLTTTSIIQGDKIKVEMTSSASCPSPSLAVSNEVTMNITNSAVASVSITDPGAVCFGETITFTATPVNGGTPTYQWFVNDNPVSNETSSEFTSSTLEDGDTIRVEMIPGSSCASMDPVVSNKVVMEIDDAVIASVSITDPGAVCFGEAVTFTATPVNGGTPTYQWFKSGIPISGETASVFTSADLENGDTITVEMTSNLSCASPIQVISNKVPVIINQSVVPEVSIQSTAETICDGDLVAFTIHNITGEGLTPVYSWYVNEILQNGETGNSFSSNALPDGAKVKLQITSSDMCASPLVAESEEIIIHHSLSVEPSVTIGVTGGTGTTLCEGEIPALEVVSASGGGNIPTFQWKLNGDDISNAVSNTYIPASITDGDRYSVVMTTGSSCASTPTAISDELVFAVQAAVTPSVSITVSPDALFCKGEELTFSIDSEENQGDAPTYQWIKNGNAIVNATGNSYTSSDFINTDEISLTLISNGNCLAAETATSNTILLTESPTPSSTITATSTFCSYETVKLYSSIVNGGIYEWYLNDVIIPGENIDMYETNTPGDYSVKITTPQGCDSLSAPFSITKIPALDVSVINTDPSSCPDQAPVLSSSVSDQSLTYNWINANDEIVHENNSEYTPAASGNYRVIVQSGLCSDTSTAYTVNIETLTIPIISGPETPVCESKSVLYKIVNSQPGSIYEWVVPANASIITGQGTDEMLLVYFETSDGKITVTEMLSATCPGLVGEIDISMQQCGFRADFTADQTSICAGESVQFTNASTETSNNTTYLWDFGNGTTSIEENPNPIQYTEPGLYTVTLTITDGISNTKRKTNYITVNKVELISSIEGPTESCLTGEATYLVPNHTGYSYNWSVNNAQLVTNNGNAVTVNFNTSGIAEIVLNYSSDQGCSANELTKSVTINNVPDVHLSSPTTFICQRENVSISATGATPGASYTWFKDNRIISGANSSTFRATEGGSFWTTINNGSCTWNSDTIHITMSNLAVDAGPDQVIEQGTTVELIAIVNVPVTGYSWKPAGIAAIPNPIVTPASSTAYIVTVTDEQGCTATDIVEIKVVSPLFIPNAFTPNGDGIHDEWVIEGIERFENFSVQVFNRWGNIVFDSTKEQGMWKGEHNGEILPVSTYYYVIKYKENGEEKSESGSVLLTK